MFPPLAVSWTLLPGASPPPCKPFCLCLWFCKDYFQVQIIGGHNFWNQCYQKAEVYTKCKLYKGTYRGLSFIPEYAVKFFCRHSISVRIWLHCEGQVPVSKYVISTYILMCGVILTGSDPLKMLDHHKKSLQFGMNLTIIMPFLKL